MNHAGCGHIVKLLWGRDREEKVRQQAFYINTATRQAARQAMLRNSPGATEAATCRVSDEHHRIAGLDHVSAFLPITACSKERGKTESTQQAPR
jgi:hypothetical protein